MKKALGLFACVMMLGAMLPTLAFAAPARPAEAFTVSEYDVSTVITADQVYDVTETIHVNFTEQRHGIYRSIPTDGAYTVEDIGVDVFPFTVTNDENNTTIRIGDADSLVDGEQIYKIHYRLVYRYGAGNMDEINFHIVGTGWDTTIETVKFTVTLPAAIDAAALSFAMGGEGAGGYRDGDLKYTVDGPVIAGTTTRMLRNYEGLTMLAKLPEGYFQPAGSYEKTNEGPGVRPDVIEAPIDHPASTVGGVAVGAATGLLVFVGFGVIAAFIVLAVIFGNRGNGGGGPVRPGGPFLDQNLIDRQNQTINDMNAMNNTSPPTDTGPATGGFTGGSDGGASTGGGGGSW